MNSISFTETTTGSEREGGIMSGAGNIGLAGAKGILNMLKNGEVYQINLSSVRITRNWCNVVL
jgi:hypothetical protein